MPRTPPRLAAVALIAPVLVTAWVGPSPTRADDPPATQPTAVSVDKLKALLPAKFATMPQQSVDTVADAGMANPIATAHYKIPDSPTEFGDISLTDDGGSAFGLAMVNQSAGIGRNNAESAVVYHATTVAGYPADSCTTKVNGTVVLNVVVEKRFIVAFTGSLTMNEAALKAAAEQFDYKALAALAK